MVRCVHTECREKLIICLAFASSAGSGSPISPIHPGNGLSKLGEILISEMNRLGGEQQIVV